MIKTKENKGITLMALVITIVLMLIVSSTTIYTSMERFELNKFKKLTNDLELLEDKVSNYYLKYNGLPVVRDDENEKVKYTYTSLDFEKGNKDNENYYILDIEALEGITLNYGKEGFENINLSDDVYIINEQSMKIYYVKGIEFDGVSYHTLNSNNENFLPDDIPATNPQIKVIEGNLTQENSYIGKVTLEFIPGINKFSKIDKTTYIITKNNEVEVSETDISSLENNMYHIFGTGTYKIELKTYTENGKQSKTEKTINVTQIQIGDYVQYDVSYEDMYTGYNFTSTDGWQYIGNDEDGNYLILSTGVPCMLNYFEVGISENPSWWATDNEIPLEYLEKYDSSYKGIYAAYGLRNKFTSIQFVYQSEGLESSIYNQGIFRKINSVQEGNITGNIFLGSEYGSKVLGVHALSLEEINRARNLEEFDTTLVENPFRLDNNNYSGLTCLSTPKPDDTASKSYIYAINANGAIIGNFRTTFALRPVVVLSKDINLNYNQINNIWQIN